MFSLNDFNNVIDKDITIEEVNTIEFDFFDFILRRENNHYEVQFESEEGEIAIVVEREDFVNGKFGFEIDGSEHELLLEDFDRIDKFYHEKCIQ
jgi:hypothetical protein